MTILVAGNKNYGLSNSVNKIYSDATFLSRTTGYDLTDSDIQQQVALMSLEYQVFLSISCLHSFSQIELIKKVIDTWIENNHEGYLIAVGSSADTPVNGNSRIYPVEKRAVRSYLRQISQICSSESPANFKVTYLSPGNLHTPSMDRKLPTTLKLDCDYVAGIIDWLINQPANINISEFCLDRIQR
jgi:hypothetical protein